MVSINLLLLLSSTFWYVIGAAVLLIPLIILVQKSVMKNNPRREEYQAMHDDPENWKWGVFYYNPKDDRLFPTKRISGLGWTVNFANPYSILAIIILIILMTVIAKYLTKA